MLLLWPAGCEKRQSVPIDASADIPADFSFALTWNCYGVSSYDSATGKLVKTTDATHPEDYVTCHALTDGEREYVYNLNCDLDVNSYPDEYDPGNGGSEPPMTLILTVRAGGVEKTIRAEHISLLFESENEKGQRFLSTCKDICNMLMATEEWKALPDYEFLYC